MRTPATHTTRKFFRGRLVAAGLLSILALARPALAGPPLLCHPFDIASAASLPWSGVASWYDGKAGYDIQRLVDDTAALLTPATPIIVRMETLRRASIYASRDAYVARRLFAAVNDKIKDAGTSAAKSDPLATFDAGYLTETFKEIGISKFGAAAEDMAELVRHVDGYALVQKSLALRADDGSVEFAAALIAASNRDRVDQYAEHARKARASAKQDALLGRNLKYISD